MNLEDLPPEILTIISDYTGIYNFNLSQVSLLFREIAGKKVTLEQFRNGLFREGDLATIIKFNLPFSEKNIEESVYFGHLHVLIWAYEKKEFNITKVLTLEVAKRGYLEILKWIRGNSWTFFYKYLDNLYLWDEWTCAYAARGGQLEVLKWLRENKCPWDKWTCAYAARGGHLEVLLWARGINSLDLDETQICPWDSLTCAYAAEGGHLELLKWLRGKSSLPFELKETQICPWNSLTCTYTVRNGNLEILQWVLANGCPRDETLEELAIKHNHLEIVRWLRENS